MAWVTKPALTLVPTMIKTFLKKTQKFFWVFETDEISPKHLFVKISEKPTTQKKKRFPKTKIKNSLELALLEHTQKNKSHP
jgi:hypothetical protein